MLEASETKIPEKIFEINSSFYVKREHYGKSSIRPNLKVFQCQIWTLVVLVLT